MLASPWNCTCCRYGLRRFAIFFCCCCLALFHFWILYLLFERLRRHSIQFSLNNGTKASLFLLLHTQHTMAMAFFCSVQNRLNMKIAKQSNGLALLRVCLNRYVCTSDMCSCSVLLRKERVHVRVYF